MAGENARQLQHGGATACIIIGAGRIGKPFVGFVRTNIVRLQGSAETSHWARQEASDLSAGEAFVSSVPIDLAPVLEGRLFEGCGGVVLTSATLSVEGRFDFLRSRLGVTEAEELLVASPFDHSRQAVLYLASDAASFVSGAALAVDGGGLAG